MLRRNNRPSRNSITINCKCCDEKTQEKESKMQSGNKAEWAGVVINLLVGVVTLFLFGEAIKQNGIARDNYNLAKATFDSTIDAGKADDIRADSALAIQKSSAQAQIDALEETQKDFSLENRAFAEITNISIDTLKTKKIINFDFEIFDFGKSPAEIKEGKFDVLIAGKNVLTDTIKPYFQYKITPVTISQGVHAINNVKLNVPTQEIFNDLENRIMFIYFAGNFKYYSIINNRFYTKEFAYKIFMGEKYLSVISIK